MKQNQPIRNIIDHPKDHSVPSLMYPRFKITNILKTAMNLPVNKGALFSCPENSLTRVVWNFDTFENNFGINHELTAYL